MGQGILKAITVQSSLVEKDLDTFREQHQTLQSGHGFESNERVAEQVGVAKHEIERLSGVVTEAVGKAEDVDMSE